MNCVPDSAAAQHMESYNERKLSVSDYRRRICLSSEVFYLYIDKKLRFDTELHFLYHLEYP